MAPDLAGAHPTPSNSNGRGGRRRAAWKSRRTESKIYGSGEGRQEHEAARRKKQRVNWKQAGGSLRQKEGKIKEGLRQAGGE